MNILYVDENETYHRNDRLNEELVRLGHNVKRVLRWGDASLKGIDVVWVEMVTRNTKAASHATFTQPLVIRLSAMEIYKGYMDEVNWSRVSAFLVEGKHLKDYFFERWGSRCRGINPRRVHLFPTGLRMSEFPLRRAKPNNKIAVVSQIHWRKGVQLIPYVLQAIPGRFTIDVIGKIVDKDALNYLTWKVKEMGLEHRFGVVDFKWPREKLVQWLQGYTYLLHPSYTDGVPRAVNEAMACGLMPLVHRYRGADALYPKWCIWDNVEEVSGILEREVNPQEYRKFVDDHYSLKMAGRRADELLRGLV